MHSVPIQPVRRLGRVQPVRRLVRIQPAQDWSTKWLIRTDKANALQNPFNAKKKDARNEIYAIFVSREDNL
jgi:hypothetical protein